MSKQNKRYLVQSSRGAFQPNPPPTTPTEKKSIVGNSNSVDVMKKKSKSYKMYGILTF